MAAYSHTLTALHHGVGCSHVMASRHKPAGIQVGAPYLGRRPDQEQIACSAEDRKGSYAWGPLLGLFLQLAALNAS